MVAYDSTNLPNVVGDVGQLVPTGDVDALTDALAAATATAAGRRRGEDTAVPTSRGSLGIDTWRSAVEEHLVDYSQEVFEQGFLDVLGAAASRPLPLGRGAVA